MMKTYLTHLFVAAALFFSGVLVVQAQLVPCSGVDCSAGDLVGLIDNIIQSFLLPISWILGAMGFAVAGFWILTSGGNEGRLATGKKMMWGVFWGLLLVHMAYLLVTSVLAILGGGTIT